MPIRRRNDRACVRHKNNLAHPLDHRGDERARILVVDDDPRNLLALQTVLEDLADVVTASSGEEALRHLLKDDFAVILLDVYMPGMDGYETAQIIRSREQTKRIPIVFLSAVNKESEHLLRGYAMGAVDYVFKPVEPIVLQSKVAVFVDLFLMRREIQRKAHAEQALLDENLRANAELLRTEQELRLAEQRQLAIIQSLPIILYLEEPDAEPRIPRFVSGNFEGLTGYDFEKVRHTPGLWRERLHPDDQARVEKAIIARDKGDSARSNIAGNAPMANIGISSTRQCCCATRPVGRSNMPAPCSTSLIASSSRSSCYRPARWTRSVS